MKLSFKLLLPLIVVGGLASCDFNPGKDVLDELDKLDKELADQNSQFRTVSANDLYTLDVPSYMKMTSTLNDEASMQYMSEDDTKYILVLDEDKETFVSYARLMDVYDEELSVVENYANVQIDDILTDLNVLRESDIEGVEINGYDAQSYIVTAKEESIPAPFTAEYAFIEGEDNLYMIMTWAPAIMDDVFKEDRHKMVMSFQEL